MALLFFVNGLVIGSWIPRLPEIRDRLTFDLRTLGLTLALGGLGSLIGSSISGVVVGRIGSRRTAVAAATLLLALLPLIALAPSAALFAGVLAMMGFVDSHADVGMNAVGVRVEEAVGRSIMTRLHGLWSLGTLLGSAVSALAVLVELDLGPQLAMLSLAGLLAVLAAARLIPHSPPRAGVGRRSGRLAIGLMLAGGAAVFIEGAPLDWSAIFLMDVTGAGGALAGVGVIFFTGGMLAGRLAGDHLVDRFGAVPILFSGIGLSVAAMSIVVVMRLPGISLAGFGMWGVGISVALPVLYRVAGSHPSFQEGSGLAALTVGTRLGFMTAPALMGVAAASWGLSTALAVVVGLAAAASIIAIRLTLATPKSVEDSLPDTDVS